MDRRRFLSYLFTVPILPYPAIDWRSYPTMSYTPNPDDASAPAESVLAGTAAAEFRALKQKIDNLFLLTGYDPVLMQQAIKAGTQLLISIPPSTSTGIAYGHAVNVTRNDTAASGGTGVSAVAAQLTAIQGNNCNNVNNYVFGIATEAWTSPTNSQAILVGAESSVISQYNDNNCALVGLDVVFKNRPDALLAGAVVQGLGANHYNLHSRGIQITAQGPSTSGELCGWHKGITFEENSISQALVAGVVVPGLIIDMTNMGNPTGTNPWTTYKHSSALALSEYMSITWDKLQFLRTFCDSANTIMWFLASGGNSTTPTVPTKIFGFDYNNNYLTLPTVAVTGAPGAPTGTFPMKVNGVVRNVHFS